MQWRGFVLHRQHSGVTASQVLEMIDRENRSTEYDPQGVFDAFLGQVPA